MKIDVKKIKEKFFNNRKVAENYFFMTFLQGASLLIGLLLFPYLIRTLGKEVYGMYVFIFSNVQLFAIFVNFGFDYPALKKISLHPTDNQIKSRTVSEVFSAKIYLLALCTVVFSVLIFAVPFVRANAVFYIVIFTSLLINILFPVWYFQGIQKMKFVTYVNLSVRILTIPLILIFVKSPADLLKYTLIVTFFPVAGAVFTFFYLQIKEKIHIRFVSLASLKPVFADALPLFWTTALGTLKKESVTFILGTFFSMGSIALYDLANKIISVPRLITGNINWALFPNVIQSYSVQRVKKIMNIQKLLSLLLIVIVVSSGYWIVLLLGGESMLPAYPLVVVLSVSFFTWFVNGCYIYFIFIPQKRNDLVFKGKLVEMTSLSILLILSTLFLENIIFLVLAIVLAELIEIVYCYFVTRKNKLLEDGKFKKENYD